MYAATNWMQAAAPGEARWGFGIGCRGSMGQSELGVAALPKAVWWDLRLASLLTHLFILLSLFGVQVLFLGPLTLHYLDGVFRLYLGKYSCSR